MIQRIDAGPRMSEACLHGGIVHLAGQVPETAGADIETQTREVLEAIDALLAQADKDGAAAPSAPPAAGNDSDTDDLLKSLGM